MTSYVPARAGKGGPAMSARILVSWNVEDAKRNLDRLAIWLKALEETGEDCELDFKSIEIIRKRLDTIGERHGDRGRNEA